MTVQAKKQPNGAKEVILLTGATGFLGSHILKGLVESERFEVLVLKRSKSDLSRIRQYEGAFSTFDVDRVPLTEVFASARISQIVHTAVEYGRGTDSCYPVLETNLMFPIALIEEAIRHGVATFVNTDSYFNKEHMAYSYLLNYSLSKKSLLTWLKYFSKRIKIVNVVLEHLYGPMDNRDKFMEKMVREIAIERKPRVDLTFGHQKRDFIFVSDVVAAYLTLLEMSGRDQFRYREYSLGTGQSSSIRSAVETIKELSGSPTELCFGVVPYRDDEIMNSVADIVELSNLGWSARVDLKSGLRATIDDYRSNAAKAERGS